MPHDLTFSLWLHYVTSFMTCWLLTNSLNHKILGLVGTLEVSFSKIIVWKLNEMSQKNTHPCLGLTCWFSAKLGSIKQWTLKHLFILVHIVTELEAHWITCLLETKALVNVKLYVWSRGLNQQQYSFMQIMDLYVESYGPHCSSTPFAELVVLSFLF